MSNPPRVVKKFLPAPAQRSTSNRYLSAFIKLKSHSKKGFCDISLTAQVPKKDLEDQQYIQWLRSRTLISGIIPPIQISKEWMSMEMNLKKKGPSVEFIHVVDGDFRLERYAQGHYEKFQMELSKDFEEGGEMRWIKAFVKAAESLKIVDLGLLEKLGQDVSRTEKIRYAIRSIEALDKCVRKFAQMRKIMQMLYEALRLENAGKHPIIYDLLLSMDKYQSGLHLLQASRHLSIEPTNDDHQYSFHGDLLSPSLHTSKMLEKIFEETFEKPCFCYQNNFESKTATIIFNPFRITLKSALQEEEKDPTQVLPNLVSQEDQIRKEIIDGILSETLETGFDQSAGTSCASDCKARRRSFTLGVNNSYVYIYLEGCGIYKISEGKIISHSCSPELTSGNLSFVFLNNTDEPCIRRGDDTYTKNIPYLKLNKKLEVVDWLDKEKQEYVKKSQEYHERNIQPFEITSASVILSQSNKERIRFMRNSPIASDGAMIYALSSTVEIDSEYLSSLSEINLWDNAEKWIKKTCYWQIQGYDKNTLFHKF